MSLRNDRRGAVDPSILLAVGIIDVVSAGVLCYVVGKSVWPFYRISERVGNYFRSD